MNLASLQETRASKIAELRALGDNPDATKFDAIEAEVRKLDKDIKRAATLAEFERQSEAETDQKFEAETREFSVAKALREGPDGLTGREREVHDELSKGRETRGIMVPTSIIFGEQRAAMTTTTAADMGMSPPEPAPMRRSFPARQGSKSFAARKLSSPAASPERRWLPSR